MSKPADRLADIEDSLARLTREPDFDAPELKAYDAADLLLLERAAELWRGSSDVSPSSGLVIMGDRHGALTLGTARMLRARTGGAAGIRTHQDPLLSERALAANAERMGLSGSYENHLLGDPLLRGAQLVLLQLPRSLAELEEIVWNIAHYADPDVIVLAGGRDKHMSHSMNEVFSRNFSEVTAGRGWRKSRVLTAQYAKPRSAIGDPRFPESKSDPDLPFALFAFGATFGGATLDHGSRLLLRTLGEQPPKVEPQHIVDIGCGNGVLAVSAALSYPAAEVIASDQSGAAVAASRLTATAAGVEDRVTVVRADASEAVPEGWAELVLLNPPFHSGSTVHIGVGQRLIRSCARALAHGGELRLVFNTHLGYRQLLEREIGPTRQLARNKTFTVLAATKR